MLNIGGSDSTSKNNNNVTTGNLSIKDSNINGDVNYIVVKNGGGDGNGKAEEAGGGGQGFNPLNPLAPLQLLGMLLGGGGGGGGGGLLPGLGGKMC